MSASSEPDPVSLPDPEAVTASPFRFFVFTVRDPRTDFRLPLAEALRAHHETWYIWLKGRPLVWPPESVWPAEEMSLQGLFALLRRVSKPDRVNIYFISINTLFPLILLMMRLFICGRGVWCLDMHDDLLYDKTGFQRFRAAASIKLQVWLSDVIVRSAESLRELFPTSVAFGNASQIGPIERASLDYRRVLVMASLDSRFDFESMHEAAQACPENLFEIHGQISKDNKVTQAALATLLHDNPNITHHGPYGLADLERILGDYAVTFAPYRTGTRLTRYLDPLRFYHCLNSGMELISTPIPQSENLANALHLVRTPTDVAAALERLADDPSARRNIPANYRPQTWHDRAARLVAIMKDLPKTARL